MRHHFDKPHSTIELAWLLDDLSAGCDPEFDFAHEELEREFAERRFQFTNIA
jgi:hypothetical protein